jgi:hypothetical protein
MMIANGLWVPLLLLSLIIGAAMFFRLLAKDK